MENKQICNNTRDFFNLLSLQRKPKEKFFIGISGSWRTFDDHVVDNTKSFVRKVLSRGDFIISGGALGVDYFVVEEAIRFNCSHRLKIFLPIPMDLFLKHYEKKEKEGVIDKYQAKAIISQLTKLKTKYPDSIIDSTKYTVANEESYLARNTTIINNCNALACFQVNDSQGVEDAMQKALKQSKPVYVKKFYVSLVPSTYKHYRHYCKYLSI
jgi:hypothetical protein